MIRAQKIATTDLTCLLFKERASTDIDVRDKKLFPNYFELNMEN